MRERGERREKGREKREKREGKREERESESHSVMWMPHHYLKVILTSFDHFNNINHGKS